MEELDECVASRAGQTPWNLQIFILLGPLFIITTISSHWHWLQLALCVHTLIFMVSIAFHKQKKKKKEESHARIMQQSSV